MVGVEGDGRDALLDCRGSSISPRRPGFDDFAGDDGISGRDSGA